MQKTINTELITDFMQKQNLNKKAFCELCDISVYMLNKVLLKNTKISIVPYIKIADAIKISLDDLIYSADNGQ